MGLILLLYVLLFADVIYTAKITQSDLFFHSGEQGHGQTGDEGTKYPANSLIEPSSLYPLGGEVPSVRMHHSVVYTDKKVIVFGGYSSHGALRDDVHIYDTAQQRWSGAILRYVETNNAGHTIDISGNSNLGNDVLEPREENNATNIFTIPLSPVGFEGDPPAKRAEHRAVAVDGNMYVFGGYGGDGSDGSGMYGLMNDLYRFDPNNLFWTYMDASSGHLPPRRAGHVMIADPTTSPELTPLHHKYIYLFGGRGETQTGAEDTTNVALNDVWRYNVDSNHWTLLSRQGGSTSTSASPVGRQHATAGMLLDRLFIFGGMDPKSGLLYQDLWAFDTNTHEWQQLYSTSSQTSGIRRSASATSTYSTSGVSSLISGFAPPPMFGGHFIPFNETSFMIYGGLGSGGACGSKSCGQKLTTLQQIYRFTIATEPIESNQGPYRMDDVFNGVTEDASYSSKAATVRILADLCSWNYSRLSGGLSDDDMTRGRRRKNYGLEEVAFATDTGYLYEIGGIQAVSGETLSADQTATGHYLPISLDSGGSLIYKAFDEESGEQLRSSIDPIANKAWEYTDGFKTEQPIPKPKSSTHGELAFVQGFKTHRVTEMDVVMISGTDDISGY
jgi:N-acetylneuraminic acid mutarotase